MIEARDAAAVGRAAKRLLGARDFDAAFPLYLTLAEHGDAAAQSMLGWMYLTGRGIERDPERARRWIAPSARQGDAHAQWLLGRAFQSVGRDGAARVWYENAAAQDYPPAYYGLATLYRRGLGVKRDMAMSLALYERAAAAGNLPAQAAYARRLIAGDRGPRQRLAGLGLLARVLLAARRIARHDVLDPRLRH